MTAYEIRANEKYNSNEVYFTSKPDDDIRAALKALHMIWNHKKACWYGFIAADKTGDGIIYDMFRYELANHEYGYTMDLSETLEACGYTRDEINADERLLHGLKKACDDIVNSDIDE